jgi:hypothetical protein
MFPAHTRSLVSRSDEYFKKYPSDVKNVMKHGGGRGKKNAVDLTFNSQ